MLIFGMVLFTSPFLASNQAYAGALPGPSDPCADCEVDLDDCLALTGGDPIDDSMCVLAFESCLLF